LHKWINFHCEKLRFYGIPQLSADTYQRCFLDNCDPTKIRINQLEMIGAILAFAAAVT
jgi:hypothetical protein